MRQITRKYRDPLDEVWITTAERTGLKVVRSDNAFAHSDGRSTLSFAERHSLDPDDCLAQMIFHELCHSLIEGPEAFERPDWGLDNTDERDRPKEHACLRLQAHLASRWGLRKVLAPTTDYRTFYDRLPPDPLADRRNPETSAAIIGLHRSNRAPWAPHLGLALAASRSIADGASSFATTDSLWTDVDPVPHQHPSGFWIERPSGGGSCGDCAWFESDNNCLQFASAMDAEWPGCERFEPELSCLDCGACCREAYGSVTIKADDLVVKAHPELVVERETYVELRRNGNRCVALAGGDTATEAFHCTIYDQRPSTCREFEMGGQNCLIARKRVGLSL